MKTLFVSVFAILVCIAPAFAATPADTYVGGGFGQFDLHIENLNDAGQAVSTIAHSDDIAWKLFAGWRLMPYLGVEGAYINLGHPGDNFTASGSSAPMVACKPRKVKIHPYALAAAFRAEDRAASNRIKVAWSAGFIM